jgi:hypothetical protein
MKVIRKGRPQKGWAKEFTCTGSGNGDGGCDAHLLVEQGDLFRTSSSHYDGTTDHYVTFKCPECGVLTDVENVPSNVTENLPDKYAWLQANRVQDSKEGNRG